MATLHLGVAVRNAQLDAVESTTGVEPVLELWSGALPDNCAAADSGTKIAEGTLPSDWMAAADAGAKAKAGTWTVTGLAAASTGTNAVHFRIRKTATVHGEGDISVTGGTGAMTMDNISVAEDQVVTVTGFTLTAGNAGS
jgi:hypothetical protein